MIRWDWIALIVVTSTLVLCMAVAVDERTGWWGKTLDWLRRKAIVPRDEADQPVQGAAPTMQTIDDAVTLMVRAGCTVEEATRTLHSAAAHEPLGLQGQDYSRIEQRILGHLAAQRTEPEADLDVIHALRTGRTRYGAGNWLVNTSHGERSYPEEGPADDTAIGRETDEDKVVVNFAMHGPDNSPEDEECDLWVDMRGHRFLKEDYDEWELQAAMPNKVGGRIACISDGDEIFAIVHTVHLPGLRDVVSEVEDIVRRDGRLAWGSLSDSTIRWFGGLTHQQRDDLFVLIGLLPPKGPLHSRDRPKAKTIRRRNLDLT